MVTQAVDSPDIYITEDALATITTPRRMEAYTFWSHAQLLRHNPVAAGVVQSGKAVSDLRDLTTWDTLATRIDNLRLEMAERAKAARVQPTVA